MFAVSQLNGFNADSGAQGYSANFTPTNYFQMTQANFGTFDYAKWAVSTWLKADVFTGNNRTLLSVGNNDDANDVSFFLHFPSVNRLELQTKKNGVSNGTFTTNAIFTVGTWHHFLLHYDAANGTNTNRLKLWVDGSAISSWNSGPAYPSNTAGVNATTKKTMVGARNNADTGGDGFDGLLYQVAMFSGTLPAISDIYDGATSPRELSGKAGLKFLLPFNSTITQDAVLATAWTNTGTVTRSDTTP